MSNLARSMSDLYDHERRGTAFAIDGLVEPEVLDGFLQRGVLGQTSNQTLLLAKVNAGQLDDDIAELHKAGKSPVEIFNILYNREALESAAALERWVKPEDSLSFSRETDATRAAEGAAIIAEAQTIQALSPWLFVKLANVGTSLPAIRAMIRDAIAQGASAGRLVNPNITLVFGANHYLNTVAGYLDGLEVARAAGADISNVRSVNSLFVSRLDTVIDGLIDQQLAATADAAKLHLLRHLRGKTATANAKKVYQMSRAIFLGETFDDPRGLFVDMYDAIVDLRSRFSRLDGAQMQRLLIASSGNKQPNVYSDLIYILPFFGPHLGNTMPPKTMIQFEERMRTSGLPRRDTVLDPLPWIPQNEDTITAWEEAVMNGPSTPPGAGGESSKSVDEVLRLVIDNVLEPNGTSLSQVADELRDKGAKAFADDQMKAYEAFHQKVESLKGQ